MRHVNLLVLALALLPMRIFADDQTLVTGDGKRFTQAFEDGIPSRAEENGVRWEEAGFSTDTTATPPTITDRFTFLFKGGEQPTEVRIEDVTATQAVLLLREEVPAELEGAGFRRSRLTVDAKPCAIAHGEPCSAWMFGEQSLRLYRATFTYADGSQRELLQAEPYAMRAFVERLGERIPDHRTTRPH